jgi:hypothetical protein
MTPERLIAESERLHDALIEIHERAFPYPGQRFELAMDACGIAFEHASGVRNLIAAGLPTSATALLRVQFEAVTRAMWLLYAAKDAEVEKLLGPLNEATQKAASKLPMVTDMLKALEEYGPPTAIRPLAQFKNMSANAMNSFVHSGIHPLQRHREQFPALLLEQIVKSSNGLNTICGTLAAVLTGDTSVIGSIKKIQALYLEVLPSIAKEKVPPSSGE